MRVEIIGGPHCGEVWDVPPGRSSMRVVVPKEDLRKSLRQWDTYELRVESHELPIVKTKRGYRVFWPKELM